MRTHLIALAAVWGLATPVWAGELDREFKAGDVKAPATAPRPSAGSAIELVSGTELDEESPTQAWRRGGWGGHYGGWGHGWGGHYHGGWGHGWGYGHVGYRPYYGFYGASYWPSSYYYRPYYSYYSPVYAYSYYPTYGYGYSVGLYYGW
jgi:hypothetical protein